MTSGLGDPLTEAIIGAAFEVQNILGHGFLEAVYRKALTRELGIRGLASAEEVRFPIAYKGEAIGIYVADLIVAGEIVVELKTAESISSSHVGQVLNYLAASGLKTGLILNFGKPRLEVRRVSK